MIRCSRGNLWFRAGGSTGGGAAQLTRTTAYGGAYSQGRPENWGRGKGKGKPTGGRTTCWYRPAGRPGIDGWVVGTWGTSKRALLAALGPDGRTNGGAPRTTPAVVPESTPSARRHRRRRVRCRAVRASA
jgi:hypothetical protein